MAKLSARGRTEIVRLERFTPDPLLHEITGANIRVQQAWMSDGVVLRRFNTGTWKVYGHFNPLNLLDLESFMERATGKGWTRA